MNPLSSSKTRLRPSPCAFFIVGHPSSRNFWTSSSFCSLLYCPHCGGQDFRLLGKGEVSYEFEYVPAQLIRRKHVREKLACSCGCYVVTAPGPVRVSEGVQYGPGFHAHVVVSKCADAIPLNRLAKQFRRAGVPLGRSTLCDIFHRSAELLAPLRARMLELVKHSPLVNADETPLPILAEGKTHRGYMWNFITDKLVVYVATPSRSGETPRRILQRSTGTLQTDRYTGYNAVTVPEGRTRAGCWAHCRRYFWKALETAPVDAQWYLDRIRDLYAVEYHAADRGMLGTAEHLALRKECSAAVVDEMALWLEQERPAHPPKSPLGKALTYLHNNVESLGVFLEDAAVALDNNISERLLRIVALGRKNFLFVGSEEAGDRLAILQSLVSSCELNGVNSQAYLSDVLIRIQTHSASAIDELLPHRWQQTDSS